MQTSILKDNSTGKLYALPSKIQEDAYKILGLYDIKHITTPYEIIKNVVPTQNSSTL